MTAFWRTLRRLMPPRGGQRECDEYRLLEQSALFDAAWYCEQYGGQDASAASDPVGHYLAQGAAAGLNPGPGFDGAWYLSTYPDVTAAGMNPLVHFLRHGQAEGRLPRRNRALAWDHHLWRGAEAVMAPRLQGLLESSNATPEEQAEARWALARWQAWQGDWPTVVELLITPDISCLLDRAPKEVGAGPLLLALEALCRLAEQGQKDEVALRKVLAELQQRFPGLADTCLAEANVQGVLGNDSARLSAFNALFAQHGLREVARRDAGKPLGLDNLMPVATAIHSPLSSTKRAHASHSPLVSIIVPLYNAQGVIETALRSLFEQSWRPLEIIVVDDASQDAGVDVVKRLVAKCPEGVSLKLLRQPDNRGAYAARNRGMAEASGEFLTTHDSDDWSHSEKVERQVKALQQAPEALACLSWWVRASEALLFHRWRLDGYGWVYPNLSSLMVRRSVLKVVGFWDEVKVNADSEYRERLAAAFGEAAVIEVLPGVPLSIGRAGEESLSQHGATHLVSQFVGVRRDYMQSARRWHAAAASAEALYLPPRPEQRPFPAPVGICREPRPARATHPLDEIQASGLFDAGWYLRTHIDLQGQRIEPLEHFWAQGAAEGRDPGPGFSTSGYLARYPEVAKAGSNPLLHYVREGQVLGHSPCPLFAGERERLPGRPTVLLVGHAAGSTLYGAERSLLDIARALATLNINLVVALPAAGRGDYRQALQQLSLGVAVLPYGWWQCGKAPEPATLEHFQALMRRFSVELVHVNTLVLDEPLVAARQQGIPALIHVRELPEFDAALCETLNATPARLRERALARADGIVANSHRVAQWLTAGEGAATKVAVVPNTIDMQALLKLPEPKAEPGRLVVGMLSSNLPKKGLADLEALAQHLLTQLPQARVLVFGPRTSALDALLRRQACGQAPANLEYRGYVNAPAEALAELDVVVNLSRFQESFGRTVLEAMAAARPVVAYDWGALPELVMPGETGFLVPFGDTRAAADCLKRLGESTASRLALGEAARCRAVAEFSPRALASRLACVYRRMGME